MFLFTIVKKDILNYDALGFLRQKSGCFERFIKIELWFWEKGSDILEQSSWKCTGDKFLYILLSLNK